jgi:hypothetical protein
LEIGKKTANAKGICNLEQPWNQDGISLMIASFKTEVVNSSQVVFETEEEA